MPDSQIIDRVIRILADQSGIQPQKIGLETRLLHDLELYGDEMDEVLIKVCDEFKRSCEGFEFERYFFTEAVALWLAPRFLRKRWFAQKEPFTVASLVHFAQTGLWPR